MPTKIIKIKPLEPGQPVGIANCAELGRVIRKTGKNLYLVSYQGHEIEMRRVSLLVSVNGAWKRYEAA